VLRHVGYRISRPSRDRNMDKLYQSLAHGLAMRATFLSRPKKVVRTLGPACWDF